MHDRDHHHDHDHHHDPLRGNERRTWWVVGLTAATMVVELVAGWLTGSMALLADGWHMASHAGALGLAGVAYWYARTRAHQERFTFGTGKVYALAGFASAIALALVALLMMVESVRRLVVPLEVRFDEALPVAVIGLVVNLLSAWLLGADHGDHGHAHGDHNLRAAYLHVVADALTSVLAIAALLAGQYLQWTKLDPIMGLVGGAIILRWAWGLVRGAGGNLLDVVPKGGHASEVREALESGGATRVVDLRLWQVAPSAYACVAIVETSEPGALSVLRARVEAKVPLAHLVIEVRPSGE